MKRVVLILALGLFLMVFMVEGIAPINLYIDSSKINANDTISHVRSVLTSAELPTVLAEGIFLGNIDTIYTQTISLGSVTNINSPRLIFAKQPTSFDDPSYGFRLSTSTNNAIYNTTVTFNKAVNFTDSNSKNMEITLFGQRYIIGVGTDATNLILFKSATKMNFDSSETTSGGVIINGKKYTVRLISASTTTATISVETEDGIIEQRVITEGYSRKVNGITIAVNAADSNNQKYTASIIVGADKITLTSGSVVTTGDEGTQIDGTLVSMTSNCTSLTKLVIQVAAKDSDNDALMPGYSFIDPVYKTFKLDFSAGMNIADIDNFSREDVVIRNSGDDKMQIKFTNNRNNEATFQFIKNWTTGVGMQLQSGDDGKNITVFEGTPIVKNEFVVVGNEDQGYLLKLSTLTNSSSNYANDKVKLQDVFDSSQIFEATITSEGSGIINIGGKVYGLNYYANDISTTDNWNVTLNYPDSTGTTKVVYPTIQTSKGAKITFYKPLTIDMDSIKGILIPNGNGYTTVTWNPHNSTSLNDFDISTPNIGRVAFNNSGYNITVGQFTYNLNFTTNNQSVLSIYIPDMTRTTLKDPGIIFIEGRDDNNQYNGAVISFEPGADSTDGIGLNDFSRTWSRDIQWDAIVLASNSNKAEDADLFGTIALVDSTDSDQKWITISYPDEQIYADLSVEEIKNINCYNNTQCGTDSLVGNFFCNNGNVFSNFINYICNNPGTEQSYCSNTVTMSIVQNCGNSSCDNYGNNYCKGEDVFHSRTCYDKSCGNSTCYSNQFNNEILLKHCESGFCKDGECMDIPISNFTPIIFSPKNGDIFNKRRILINISVKEEAKYIKYQLDGKISRNNNPLYIDLCNNKKCSKVERYLTFLDGNHTLGIITVNQDDRQFEGSVNFFIDSKKPRILKTLPSRNKIANGTFYVEFIEQNPKNITLSYGTINNKKIIDLDITKCSKNKNKIYCSIDINLNDYKDQKINYSFKIIDIANNLDENKPLVVKV